MTSSLAVAGTWASGRRPLGAVAPGALASARGVVTRCSRGASSGRLAFQVRRILAGRGKAVQLRPLRELLLARGEIRGLPAPRLERGVLQSAAVAEREVPGEL